MTDSLASRHQPERRASDARLAVLERDVAELLRITKGINEALSFPEESPLGRALMVRADRNHDDIVELQKADEIHTTEIGALKTTVSEVNGVVKAMRFISLLVGIVLSLLTLAQFVRPHGL